MKLLHALLAVALAATQALAASMGAARPKPRKPRPPDADETHKLWHWIEDNLEIVFPVVGVTVLLLVILAVRRGMQTSENEIKERLRQKDEIVRLMRAKLTVNPAVVSQELSFDRFHAAALLEELEREGKLVQTRATGGVASYRLKGL